MHLCSLCFLLYASLTLDKRALEYLKLEEGEKYQDRMWGAVQFSFSIPFAQKEIQEETGLCCVRVKRKREEWDETYNWLSVDAEKNLQLQVFAFLFFSLSLRRDFFASSLLIKRHPLSSRKSWRRMHLGCRLLLPWERNGQVHSYPWLICIKLVCSDPRWVYCWLDSRVTETGEGQ